jgi:hypothetical protein
MEKKIQQIVKSFILIKACCGVMLPALDQLKKTGLFKQALKNRINSLEKDLEAEVSTVFSDFSNEKEENRYNHVCLAFELFQEVLDTTETDDIDLLLELLREFKEGKIAVVTAKHHDHLLKQYKQKPIGNAPDQCTGGCNFQDACENRGCVTCKWIED